MFHKIGISLLSAALTLGCVFFVPMSPVHAEPVDYQAEAEARKGLPIQTNEIPGWPQGPAVGAEAAILMDADTGVILYAKNINERLYPASVTKLLSTLIAIEACDLNEEVTFSHDAVFSISYGSSNIAIDEGEVLTVDQCLQAILIASANEVSNALGEHAAGSMDAFVEQMNEKAAELGCTNSHFVTINGLHDDNHYTTAYDLALIGRHFFANELLCRYASTSRLYLAPTDKQPDEIVEWSKNQLFEGRTYAYEYLIGSKTGYTDTARQTLVSCAEKDGMKLICVILKEESPAQYTDTIELFNYGFGNFNKLNISEVETKYDINNAGFFYSNNDIFGNSSPILTLNAEDCLILPKTVPFSEVESVISFDSPKEGTAATVTYTYQDTFVGSASIDLADKTHYSSYEFSGEMLSGMDESVTPEEDETIVFVNVKKIVFWIVGIAGTVIFIIIVVSLINNYQFGGRRRRTRHRKKRRQRGPSSPFKNFKF